MGESGVVLCWQLYKTRQLPSCDPGEIAWDILEPFLHLMLVEDYTAYLFRHELRVTKIGNL
jgi:hypothetical protein